MRLLIAGTLLLACATTAGAAALEVPQSGGRASGIGSISGWKCPPNENLTAVIDGEVVVPLASRIARGDTAGACGNDGRNGFIAQINYGLLGDGFHTIAVRQGGQTFVTSTFHVTTFGVPFLAGASGTYTLQDFPSKGKTAVVEWVQGAQSFVVTSTGVVGSPTPLPTPTPTPRPPSAQVRYLNTVTCEGVAFTSHIGKGGVSWSSFTDVSSPYRSVTFSFFGDFNVNNGNCGSYHHPGGFNFQLGRSYVIIQSANLGEPRITLVDEGPSSAVSADEIEPEDLP